MRRYNATGANRITRAIAEYTKEDPSAPKAQHIADLLRDVRHFCDVHELDFADCDRAGKMEYRDDLAELIA